MLGEVPLVDGPTTYLDDDEVLGGVTSPPPAAGQLCRAATKSTCSTWATPAHRPRLPSPHRDRGGSTKVCTSAIRA